MRYPAYMKNGDGTTYFETLVSTANLAHHLGNPDWAVFDCRFALDNPDAGKGAYRQRHIPGAHYAHLDEDLSSPISAATGRHPLPSPELLATKLSVWGVDRDSQVVVYDDAGGAMAARMWWLLRWLGHQNVAVLDGGLQAWQREGHALTSEPSKNLQKQFVVEPLNNQWLDTLAVQAARAKNGVLLIDARAEERYRGEEEPVDPVAGHIPGAVNRPYDRNLAKDGCFLGAGQLRDEFEQTLAGVASDQVVHMCGSGVTACHNLLAMEIAQLSGSRLYAGSWSEWIRDPGRPIATGPESASR